MLANVRHFVFVLFIRQQSGQLASERAEPASMEASVMVVHGLEKRKVETCDVVRREVRNINQIKSM